MVRNSQEKVNMKNLSTFGLVVQFSILEVWSPALKATRLSCSSLHLWMFAMFNDEGRPVPAAVLLTMCACVSSLRLYGTHGSYIVTQTPTRGSRFDRIGSFVFELDKCNELTRVSHNMSPQSQKNPVWLTAQHHEKQEAFSLKHSMLQFSQFPPKDVETVSRRPHTNRSLRHVMMYCLCNRILL